MWESTIIFTDNNIKEKKKEKIETHQANKKFTPPPATIN